MMDEHTDWVNQLIYLPRCDALLSCSNDTSIKLWKLPQKQDELHLPSLTGEVRQEPVRPINSFYTIDQHQDYVRAMAYSQSKSRLFSISDDGQFLVNDLNEERIV